MAGRWGGNTLARAENACGVWQPCKGPSGIRLADMSAPEHDSPDLTTRRERHKKGGREAWRGGRSVIIRST